LAPNAVSPSLVTSRRSKAKIYRIYLIGTEELFSPPSIAPCRERYLLSIERARSTAGPLVRKHTGMFHTFEDIQKLPTQHGAALLREANLSFQFYGKGMELQILRGGARELSIASNSTPFLHSLRTHGKVEVSLGFGSITKEKQSLRVGVGGKFQSLSADEDVNSLVSPAIIIPTLAIFISKPSSSEKTVIGLQFMEGIPMREISIDIEDPKRFDHKAFTEFCHRQLSIPKKS
jgi:hypothetical protein